MLRYIYIIFGTCCVILGILGLVTPGLPTTPFILLAGYLYTKGSPYLYKKLAENKITGSYLRRMNDGISLKMRLISICIMWCMVCFTAFVVFNDGHWRYIMLVLGGIGTVFQLFFKKKRKYVTESVVSGANRDV